MQARNREAIFSALDVNGDGVITESDVKALLDGFLRSLGVPAGSPGARALHDSGQRIWDELCRQHSAGAARYDLVRQFFVRINIALFDTIDANGDGRIDEEEFVFALCRVGLAAEDVRESFGQISAGADGGITRQAWIRALREMVPGPDPDRNTS